MGLDKAKWPWASGGVAPALFFCMQVGAKHTCCTAGNQRMSAYIMSRAHLYTMITPRVFAPSKGRPHPINQGVSPVFFCTYYSTFCCAKSLQICALPPRACVHACALVRARARACARVRFCFRPSRAHLCGRVYAQAQEAVLLVAFCCAKSLRIHAVPRTGIAGWRSLSVTVLIIQLSDDIVPPTSKPCILIPVGAKPA